MLMKMLTYIPAYIFVSAALFSDTAAGFLFNNKCVAPPPCTCRMNYIDCDDKQLYQVPKFLRPNEQYTHIYIRLNHNQLTFIQAYAFQNLSSFNASNFDIELFSNHISQIDIHAFDGIEHFVTNLELKNNNLTHLPQALGYLTALQKLDLEYNPLVNIDSSVMSNIGSSLLTFSITADHFPRFPEELQYLLKLISLTINKVNATVLQSNVFRNFAASLTSLKMTYANIENIPTAFCQLTKLKSLILTRSPSLFKYNASIFDKCTLQMTSLTRLQLQENQLSTFPDIASLFPSLVYLYIANNEIHFIESTSLLGLTNLTSIDLSGNKLTRIPNAVNGLTNLKYLGLGYNQIDTMAASDLQSLHKLTSIDLKNNPLVYVSPMAFSHNPLLTDVNLYDTKLGHIPRALVGLQHLRYLNLLRTPIECSCNAMSYLKLWNFASVHYIGAKCSTGADVKAFLTFLPSCP